MKIQKLHSWDLSPREAIALQKELRQQLVLTGGPKALRFIAGADASLANGKVFGIVVIWDVQKKAVIEEQWATAPLNFPYVPGLLSFREAPALLAAFEKIKTIPDLVLFDGQGIAHPRRLGIAAHIGRWLDLPSIGVAKSRLFGTHAPLEKKQGSSVPLLDHDEQIGIVYQSRDRGNPLYISPAHRISLDQVLPCLLPCFRGYRLPEPTRLADKLSKKVRNEDGGPSQLVLEFRG